VVQRLNFRRTDAGVRREIRTRLLLALEEIDQPEDVWLWRPRFRRCLSTAIERGRQTDVATALRDDQHFAVGRAVDVLQDLMDRIDTEDQWFLIDNLDNWRRNGFTNARDAVAEALDALRPRFMGLSRYFRKRPNARK
jgi:hypothetical protein